MKFLDWLSYPRAILTALFYPLFLAICSIVMLLVVGLIPGLGRPNWLIRFWANGSLFMCGVKIKVKGLENLPQGRGVLILFNHTSFFDIFILQGLFPDLRFGAKIELFKIPFFGAAMRAAGSLPIARDNREEVYRVYREAAPRLQAGQMYALAPEGTRQNGETLGPFKTGPFVFALNTQAAILPCVLVEAHRILPKHHVLPNWGCWRRTVEVHFLPLIETKGHALDDRGLLQTQVRELMLKHYHQHLSC